MKIINEIAVAKKNEYNNLYRKGQNTKGVHGHFFISTAINEILQDFINQ